MRGRKPRPTHLKLLEGNPGKRSINRAEPKPAGDLFDPPPELPEKAVPFWTRAIADAPKGLLKCVDASVLKVWAVAAWLHSEAAAAVATGGTTTQTKDGGIMQHPSLAILNRQATLMLKAAAEMGFTPSSRSRVSTDADTGTRNPFDRFG